MMWHCDVLDALITFSLVVAGVGLLVGAAVSGFRSGRDMTRKKD